MPHKKILPMWKKLTKNKMWKTKKLPALPEVYIKPAPSPNLVNPLWAKDWVRELLPITKSETNIKRPYVQTFFIDRFWTVRAVQHYRSKAQFGYIRKLKTLQVIISPVL